MCWIIRRLVRAVNTKRRIIFAGHIRVGYAPQGVLLKMAETRAKSGFTANVTPSHSKTDHGHIPAHESDGIAARLKGLIGTESVSSFSRRCGLGESLLRKYLAGSQPNAQNLIFIADAAGVTIDWLAAGRLPKTRAEVRNAQAGAATRLNRGALAALIRGAAALIDQGMSDTKAADMAAEMYERALEDGDITADGIGPGKHAEAA